MHIAVGTKNKAKIAAVQEALSTVSAVEFSFYKVSSNVADQPLSFDETKKGAICRAKNALEESESSKAAIGLEGGLHKMEDGWYLCNWGALVTIEGDLYVSGAMSLKMPDEVIRKVLQGKELAHVMDEYTSRKDVRNQEGAVGVFTHGFVTRKDLFVPIVKLLYGQFHFKQSENKVI